MTENYKLFFASVPSAFLRPLLDENDVKKCMSGWISSLNVLRKCSQNYAKGFGTSNTTFPIFLRSYLREYPDDIHADWLSSAVSSDAHYLHQSLFSILIRLTKLGCLGNIWNSESVLDAATCFSGRRSRRLFQELWSQDKAQITNIISDMKLDITLLLESFAKSSDNIDANVDILSGKLRQLAHFFIALPAAADAFIDDSRFFEALAVSFGQNLQAKRRPVGLRDELIRIFYLTIVAAIQAPTKRLSTMMDTLFGITQIAREAQQTEGATSEKTSSYLTAIVSTTQLLRKMDEIQLDSIPARWRTLINLLNEWYMPGMHRIKRLSSGSRERSKMRQRRLEKALKSELVVQRMDNVKQLIELFPEYGLGYLERLLVAYDDNVSGVSTALLDNSLPYHLQDLDRYERSAEHDNDSQANSSGGIAHTDELDKLIVPVSRLHLGKKDRNATVDSLLDDKSSAPSKEKILAALKSFDSDDDERDDTYDVDDVGGAVDAVTSYGELGDVSTTETGEEEKLYKAFIHTPTVFDRDSGTRRSEARRRLKESTGLSDEAIEGWKLMLTRDGGKKLRQLEFRFTTDAVNNQLQIPRTAYRKSKSSDTEDEPDVIESSRSSGPRAQHYKPNTSKPIEVQEVLSAEANATNNTGSTVARVRKEAQKGSRANHNRRNQRAKKMARGGFGV